MTVGIVGCGGMGTVHAGKYALMPGVQVVAYDTDGEKLAAYCAKFGAGPAASLEALVRSVDAVDVCLPTNYHREAVLAGLAAGLPVLVEKPMGRTLEDCEAMLAAEEASAGFLMPAQVVRWFREHRAVHDAVVRGEVGLPAAVRVRRGGGPPKGEWFLDLDASGGILLDLAVHDFDWLLWTLGPATSVFSQSVRMGEGRPAAEFRGDYALTTVTFVSGAVAHLENTWMDPSGFRTCLEVSGSAGLVEFDLRSNPSLRAAGAGGTRTENNYLPSEDPYFLQAEAFLAAVRSGGPPPVTAHEGLEAVRLALAAVESARAGKPVCLAAATA